jgi:hypothetical protein
MCTLNNNRDDLWLDWIPASAGMTKGVFLLILICNI